MKMGCPMRRAIASGLVALILALGGAEQARADVIYTLANNGNGNSATALFQTVAGGYEVTVTNTEANTGDVANAICQVEWTFNTATVGQFTSFTELKASKISYSGQGAGTVTGPFDFKPPPNDPDLHWLVDPTAFNTTSLVNVSGGGLTGPGGQPVELIVAANSIATSNSPSSHSPNFNGSASFFVSDSMVPANLTANDITSVKISFGTGPETTLETGATPTLFISPVPEPSSLIMGGTAAAIGGLYIARRCLRRRRVGA
jgi:hypothetical protein